MNKVSSIDSCEKEDALDVLQHDERADDLQERSEGGGQAEEEEEEEAEF